MKKLFFSLVVVSLTCAPAFADSVLEVRCRDTSGLPSGLSIVIDRDTESDALTASFTNRDNLGPYVDLGSIEVSRRCALPKPLGKPLSGPVTYVGDDFELNIFADAPAPGSAGEDGEIQAHVYVVRQGRTFDEAMFCLLGSS
jgi:hypothetical protein